MSTRAAEQRGFVLIPEDIMVRTDLTATHKLMLGVIGRIQGRSASCYPGIAYLADSAGISERQAQRIVRDLVRRKEVIRLFHKNKTSTYSAAWATARNLRRKWAEEKGA